MNLKQLASAVNLKRPNHSILLYGPPKTGKTRLAGTAARIPEFQRIFWFDCENGSETLLHMGLTDSELEKITIYRIPDTRENPRACETILKAFSSKSTGIKICDEHGKVGCVECEKAGKSSETFNLPSLTHQDLVIIDSGSQLGDSALAMACAGKDVSFKPTWDEYGLQVKWLGDIMSVIQQAYHTNFLVITHEIAVEEEINGVSRDKIYPLVGTKSFCQKVGKYFGTVAYIEIKMGKHSAGSSSTYKVNYLSGSRVNAKMEAAKEPDLRSIFIEGGILKPLS